MFAFRPLANKKLTWTPAMKDEVFISTILQKGDEAKIKVNAEFSGISLEQLNWKPAPESWSIGQCLHHLMVSHISYSPVLDKITGGVYKMGFWERYSPFTALSGRLLKDQIQEQPKRKFKAPSKIRPSTSELKGEVIKDYFENLDSFLDKISNCRSVDLDTVVIMSPTIRFVTYTLRDAFIFLLQIIENPTSV